MTKKRKPQILPIRIYGDEILRKRTREVPELTQDLMEYISDLKETMYEKDGVGLASPQVGNQNRIFVYDPQWSNTNKKKPIIVINPEIISLKGITTFEEGCLSLPGIYANVKRAESIKVRYRNEDFQIVEKNLEDVEAIVFQHEFDHLDGILFVDHISKISRIKYNRALKRLQSFVDEDGTNLDSYLNVQ